MTGDVALFASIFLACTLAFLGHEAMHYAVALVLGRRPTFDLLGACVYWTPQEDSPTPGDWLIAGAPVLAGVVFLPVLVLVGVVWWVWIPWFQFTFLGAVTNDFDFTELDRESVENAT